MNDYLPPPQLKSTSDDKDAWQSRAERFSRQLNEIRQRQQHQYYSHQVSGTCSCV